MANGFSNIYLDVIGVEPTLYISKSPAGNDSNDGSKDSPKVTIGSNSQIGAGNYAQSNIGNRAVGDGKVIIDLLGSNLSSSVPADTIAFFNISFIDGLNLNLNQRAVIDTCTFKNLNSSNTFANAMSFNKCLFLDSLVKNNAGNRGLTYTFCIINNSILNSFSDNNGHTLINSFVDFNSEVYIRLQTDIQSCNINGLLVLPADNFTDSTLKKYAIQDELTGTPQDNGYPTGVNWLTEAQLTADGYTQTIAGWDARVAACINKDPKFNNVGLEDFSLQADSPHIGRANDGSNIGGTNIANTVLVNQDGIGTIEIIAQPEIDTTTNPNFYTVDTNEDEGYIDIIQRIGTQPIVLTEIEPIAALEFDSDIDGGLVGNQNVPDSEPQTADYPRKITTTSLATNTTTLNVTGHDVVVGEFVRVLGEDREVTAVTTDTITVGTAFRAAVASGVTFQAGSEVQLAALRPNRLTYQLRVSTQAAKPTIDAEWDNDIDPIYNYEGLFSTQEWFEKPEYVIDGNDVFGKGDAEANPAITPDEIAATWVNIRVWLRNNYDS